AVRGGQAGRICLLEARLGLFEPFERAPVQLGLFHRARGGFIVLLTGKERVLDPPSSIAVSRKRLSFRRGRFLEGFLSEPFKRGLVDDPLILEEISYRRTRLLDLAGDFR